jgi:Ala-tRNA(Pro) deacylase
MKLTDMLKDQGVAFEMHKHPTTYTSQGLAQAEHVSGYEIAKPVIVKGESGFAMCVLPAPKHLDLNKAAAALGEKQVRMASESEMADLFPDCELGAEPPVGTLFGLKTIMDASLRNDEYLIIQAGTHTEAIKIKRSDWEKVCQPQTAPIATG